MLRLFSILTTLLLSVNCFGQINNLAKTPPQPPTKREAEIEVRNHNCLKRVNKNFITRLKNYPFNQSVQIQLVSFKHTPDTLEKQGFIIEDSLPRLNDTVCYSKLSEIKALTILQVEKLTDILYNYGFGGTIYSMTESNCYNPRNAILFLDSTGKVFEFIEICFECRRTVTSSEKVHFGDMCDQKLDMIRDFFKNIGIKYGIKER